MISVAEALQILEDESAPLETIELPLGQAHGRVLAESALADRDFPPTDRSAMDGYAVRSEDLAQPGVELKLVGELRAGQAVGVVEVAAGQAARIMTGAVVPPGADTVVMVERTTEIDGARVRFDDVPTLGQHIRRQGEDLRRGRIAVEAATPIRAAEVAALTSLGRSSVRVHRAPVVHVLSTGDEIVESDRVPAAHQVRNSNAHALLAQLGEIALDGHYLGIAGDEREELERMLVPGLAGDVLLITGGVSVGRYDMVASALAAAGTRTLFHKVAVKPGKPILAGRRGDCLVFGLPGNPVSTFTTFVLFVLPTLRRLLGRKRWANRRWHAKLTAPLHAGAGREIYHLARIDADGDGWTVRRVSTTGSGDVLSLARANGFVVTPAEGAHCAAGTTVPVLSWSDLDC